jgi:hypothetical protein
VKFHFRGFRLLSSLRVPRLIGHVAFRGNRLPKNCPTPWKDDKENKSKEVDHSTSDEGYVNLGKLVA